MKTDAMASPKKKVSRGRLKTRLWDLMSLYIRLKESDELGYVSCVTCGKTSYFRDGMQAGHWVPKKKGNAIYFLEDNIHTQCVRCNHFESGNLRAYDDFMLRNYGQKRMDEILALAGTVYKLTIPHMLDLEAEVKSKLHDELAKRPGVTL